MPTQAPRTGSVADGAELYRRLQARDRKRSWVAPAGAVAFVAIVAAATFATGDGREAAPEATPIAATVPASPQPMASTELQPMDAAALGETASISATPSTAVQPPAQARAPTPARSSPPVLAAGPAVPEEESVTAAPAGPRPYSELNPAPLGAPAFAPETPAPASPVQSPPTPAPPAPVLAPSFDEPAPAF